MESSLLFFATVFIKISLSFSENSILISFVSEDNEIDTQNVDQNLVLQPAEWEFLWLTEAFISYLKFSSGEVRLDSNLEKKFIFNQLQPALIHEGIDFSKYIPQLIHSTELNSLMIIQEDMVNFKGSCIVRMLHLSLGNSVFRQGLMNYLQSSEYQSMSLDDFWHSFQYQIDRFHIILPIDIKIIMKSWTKQDGFPVVHVEIEKNVAKLRQKRYLIVNSTDYDANDTWWIPLTWTSASRANFQNTTPKYWFYKNEDEIQLQIEEDEWVIFNVRHSGFYRVNYDEASWHRIIYALHFHPLDSISAINRASIISDAFNLAKAGIIPFEIALNSIAYITRETDYLPIETALTELKFLFKYFAGQKFSKLFNNFCLTLIKPSYDRLNQHDKINDLFTRELQKKLTYWVCILGHKQCVQDVLQNFERWKSYSEISITKAGKKLMFCVAVKHNSSLEENGAIKTILNYYSRTSHISDRAIAITSLKCIEDYSILETVLEMLLSNHSQNVMQKQEIIYFFKKIATNSYKDAEFISTFIVTHHDEMFEYYGNNNIFVEILESLSEMLDVQNNSNKYYLYQTNSGDKLIETVDTTLKENIFHKDFYTNYYPNIIKWINNNRCFMSLEIKTKTKNNNKFFEIIERSFQLFQLFYQENSSSDNAFTSTSLKNSSLNASYFFWKRTFNDWEYLQSKINDNDDRKILDYHMLKIVSPIFDKLGFEEKLNDTYDDKALRSDVIDWACRLDHPDCILKTLKLFKDWRSTLRSPIPISIQKTVFCAAIKYESDDMRFFLKTYIQTKNPHQKLAIEYALGCIKDVETIQDVLAIILNFDNLKLDHRLRMISSISFYGGFGLHEILRYFCLLNSKVSIDEEELDQLNRIFETISFYISNKEQITVFQQCLNFYSNTIPAMTTFLKSFLDQALDKLAEFDYYSTNFLKWLKTTYTSFDYQLPKNLKPIKYEVSIAPEINHFYGVVKITLDVLHDSDRIVLHTTDLYIDEINVRNLITDQPIGVLFFLQHLDGRCEIYLNSIMKNGTLLLVAIEFGGNINEVRYGIYRVPLYNKDKNSDWLITTQFQMSYARRAFPCFDEPSFKAKFTIRILRPKNYVTISNMEIHHSVPSSKKIDWTWDVYKESDLISTYLIAFIVCKHKMVFEYKNYLKYWSHHSLTPYAKYSLEIAHGAVEIMSVYTRVSLPMKKIDLVEIPGFDELGMENWGIIMLDDKLASLSSTVLNANIYYSITFKEFVVVHEIVHTWFGNLVTCETWEYFWLNEGFTRYFEWQVINTIQPQLKWMEKFVVHMQHVGLAMDSQITGLPLTNPKMTLITSGIANKYDNSALIHTKAPCIVRMMHHAFGNDVFRTAIKYYLDENKWSTGTPSKLWTALEKAFFEAEQKLQGTNESIATMMESWTSQPGYPVVHVNRTNEQIIFKQERFLCERENEPMELYWIPITFTTKSQPVFTNTSTLFWMGSRTVYRSLPKTDDDEWIIVNIQQSGFYRVNYDTNIWENIFKALNQNDFGGIPEVNRAQILDDLFSLAYADYISYRLVFTGAQYLSKERGYLPWKVFFNAMNNLYHKFDNPAICLKLKKYITKLITPYYDEIQDYVNLNVDHKNDFNIALILVLARNVDFNALVVKSVKAFKLWSENPEIPINQKIFSLCIALQHSSHSDWELLQQRYFKSRSKSEKLTILKTLGCSRNVTTLTEYIKFAVFNGSLETDYEIKTALYSIFYVERLSTDAILNFFSIYHEKLTAQSLWGRVHILLLAVSNNTYTSDQIKRLIKLIEDLKNKNDIIRKQLQDYLSQISIRKRWFDDHISDILQALV